MRTEAFASELTVWMGSARYTFPPGRDVTVGRDMRCDIRLADLPNSGWTSRIHLLLRFTGTRWVAIDTSRNGIYLDGLQVSRVSIHDGDAITLGDPQTGPRLVFRFSSPTDAPPGTPYGSPRAVSRRSIEAHPDPQPKPPATEPTTDPVRLGQPKQPPAQPAQPPSPPAQPTPPPSDPITEPIPLPQPESANVQPSAAPQDDPSSSPTTDPLPRVPESVPDGVPDSVAEQALAPEPAPPPDEVLMSQPVRPGTGEVQADRLGLTVDGHELLTDVSFSARPGTLTAVTGPSAARNSALIKLLSGATQPTSGEVTVDGHAVQAARSRIGMVPRDDLVHRQLTVERAVGYAAELRLPPDTSTEDRRQAVNQVLTELELIAHRTTRVSRLSAEERQRASVAVELLTRPSLLIIDEPVADLDSALMMQMARRLADYGPSVVVATRSLDHLTMCDQVLLLTSAGTTAFVGPPTQIDEVMGTTDWSQVVSQVRVDPDGAHAAFLARQQLPAPPPPPAAASAEAPPPHISLRRQVSLVARRQARLLVANWGYLIFLAILPFVFGALSLVVPGHAGSGAGSGAVSGAGFGRADPYGSNPHEAVEILIVLNIGAVIIGTALTIRDLAGQRAIFRREQSIALSAAAFLAGKFIVFSLAAAIETAILTAIVVLVKGAPVHGAVMLGNPVVELYLTVAATAIVSASVGLMLSGLANDRLQLLPMLVVVILASLVFAGGLLPLAGKLVLEQISWLIPAQWGFAALACVVDLRRIDQLAGDREVWTHYWGWWLFDMANLIILGLACTGFLWWRLRLPGLRPFPPTSSPSGLPD